MGVLTDFDYRLAFGAVIDALENKRTDFDANFYKRADTVRGLFQGVRKTLGGILEGSYDAFDNLKEILIAAGFEGNTLKEYIEKKDLVFVFNRYISQLNNLRSHPKRFHAGDEASGLLKLCKNIEPIFEIKTNPSDDY